MPSFDNLRPEKAINIKTGTVGTMKSANERGDNFAASFNLVSLKKEDQEADFILVRLIVLATKGIVYFIAFSFFRLMLSIVYCYHFWY